MAQTQIHKVLAGDAALAGRYLPFAKRLLRSIEPLAKLSNGVASKVITFGADIFIKVSILQGQRKILITAVGGYDLIYRDVATIDGTLVLQFYGYSIKRSRQQKIFTIDILDLTDEIFIDAGRVFNELIQFYDNTSSFTLALDVSLPTSEVMYPKEIKLTQNGSRVSRSGHKRYTIAAEGAPFNYRADTKWLRFINLGVSDITKDAQSLTTKNTQDGQEVAMVGGVVSASGFLSTDTGISIIHKASSTEEDFTHKYQFPFTRNSMIADFPLAINPVDISFGGPGFDFHASFQHINIMMVGDDDFSTFFEDSTLLLTAPRNWVSFQSNPSGVAFLGYQEIWRIAYDGSAPTREFSWVQFPGTSSREQKITEFYTDYTRTESGFVSIYVKDDLGAYGDLVTVISAPYTRILGFTTKFSFNLGAEEIMGYGPRLVNHTSIAKSPYSVTGWKFADESFALHYHNSDGTGYLDLYKDAIITWIKGVINVVYAPDASRSVYRVEHNPISPEVCVVYESDRPAISGQRLNVKVFLLNVITGALHVIQEGATMQPIIQVTPIKVLEIS